MHVQRHVADLIEENRALIGLFEFSNVAPGRSSERALLMSEEFRLDQFRGDRRAIQGDKWTFCAAAALVNRARN